MIQHIAIFLSTILIVITAQPCCPSPSGELSNKRSINILIPVPYQSPFVGLSGGSGGALGSLGGGLGTFQNPFYFGYFTRYLGRASANGMCPAGVNINGHCWYDSIGNKK
ncbi:Uncharacterized protein BM_BM719 [Brugia malayi]|uniref:Bm719 n=1 Tax=Brugia malayi TaxID=6279 RepID=A0A0J9Y3S6_BRUMA|nr:Uncharacterized protein BM_BM719 [Brugia malayi]CDQ01319.1 Bm719 [Brugia malayi]VIO95584.1 Uncharacterized protein BM_BM719 [Brugia malayi]